MAYLRIGDVAQRVGVCAQTLRNYEAAGVIPRAMRTRSGYRLYRLEDLARIEAVIFGEDAPEERSG